MKSISTLFSFLILLSTNSLFAQYDHVTSDPIPQDLPAPEKAEGNNLELSLSYDAYNDEICMHYAYDIVYEETEDIRPTCCFGPCYTSVPANPELRLITLQGEVLFESVVNPLETINMDYMFCGTLSGRIEAQRICVSAASLNDGLYIATMHLQGAVATAKIYIRNGRIVGKN